METVIAEHIEITPEICGGKPRIAGHRIKVQDVVLWHERLGLSADEIVFRYPTLTLSDVYAALVYYYDHQELIRSHIQEDEKLSVAMQVQSPSRVQEKLRSQDAQSDLLSPG